MRTQAGRLHSKESEETSPADFLTLSPVCSVSSAACADWQTAQHVGSMRESTARKQEAGPAWAPTRGWKQNRTGCGARLSPHGAGASV